jgi:hypothetical protein
MSLFKSTSFDYDHSNRLVGGPTSPKIGGFQANFGGASCSTTFILFIVAIREKLNPPCPDLVLPRAAFHAAAGTTLSLQGSSDS